MHQVSAILVQHDPKSLNGPNGPFTLHKFKAADGTWYQTTKTPIANEAYSFVQSGAPCTLNVEPTQNGDYLNNVIHGVFAGGDVAAAAPGAPTGGGAPTAQAAPTGSAGQSGAPPRAEFQRSKEEMRRTAALEIASTLFHAQNLSSYVDFLKIAARVEKDIANGYQTAASEPQAQTSSSSVGGGEQAAAPEAAAEAPAAEVASAPVSPDDDIPFMPTADAGF